MSFLSRDAGRRVSWVRMEASSFLKHGVEKTIDVCRFCGWHVLSCTVVIHVLLMFWRLRALWLVCRMVLVMCTQALLYFSS